MGILIAQISEVKGISVKAELYRLLPPFIIKNSDSFQAPRINAFVKTNVGLDTVICQIKGELYNRDFSKNNSNHQTDYYLDLQVIGYISGNEFYQGLRMLPIVSATVETLDLNDYKIIYKTNKEWDIYLGNDLFDHNRDIYCDTNKLIPSHIGIFGNTGSGKSNTLVTLYNQYLNKIPNDCYASKVIVYDLNNEYDEDAIVSKGKKKIFKLSTRKKDCDKIHINFNNLSEDQMSIFLNATEKTQIPILKHAYRLFNLINSGSKTEIDFKDYIKNMILNSQVDLFKKVRFFLEKFTDNLDGFEFYKDGNAYYITNGTNKINHYEKEKFDDVMNNIVINIPNAENCLDLFEFSLIFTIIKDASNGVNSEFSMPLLSRFDKLKKDFEKVFIFSKDSNSIIDGFSENCLIYQLGNLNEDMKEIVPSIVSSIIYQNQIDQKNTHGDNNRIVSFVIDEAHNLLYEDDKDKIHSSVIDVFEKIVKEGRKFATFLTIASQRPSDISNTIMSQIHNYFIHKLVNPNDINKIKKCVAYMDEESLNLITVLGPGECIYSGVAISVPTFVKIKMCKHNQPNSKNVILFGENGILKNKELNFDF